MRTLRWSRRLLAPTLAGIAALHTAPTGAADGRIPIWQATAISVPGHYIVTRDFGAASPIFITARDVVLDLGGHTVTATGGGNAVKILISGPGSGAIAVRNGLLRGGTGVLVQGGFQTRIRLEDLDVVSTGFAGIGVLDTPAIEITRCAVHDSPNSSGIYLNGPGFSALLRGNHLTAVGNAGIELYGIESGEIRENVVTRFATTGIAVFDQGTEYGGVRVEGNTIRAGGMYSTGIVTSDRIHRVAIIGNVVESVEHGITVWSNGNRLTGNVIGMTIQDGISVLGSDCTVERNTIESGSGDGVRINGSNNVVDSNTIMGHLGAGIAFQSGTGHLYRGNVFRNNLAGSVSGAATDAGGNIP